MSQPAKPSKNTEWYKDAIIYELNVRAFYDSNADGIGDLKGVTLKLDYLKELGVSALWLLPFFPSPFRDGGYDISNYVDVDPTLGTLADFNELAKGAHERGIKVIIELVLNHTSNQHEWFKQSRISTSGSEERDLYVWSKDSHKYEEARIIFKDFETSNWSYDQLAKAYYWHRFYSHQPDLNYDSPLTRKKIFDVVSFWLGLGADGLRLDAVPYLFEREGTNCENLPETHSFLSDLRAHIDSSYADRMLLAEANQWPDDAIAYFGKGDECQMAFNFGLMPRMFLSIQMEDRFPILEILKQTPSIPENCQWALFLRNHDELTLEMVTDEERDYMYRAYTKDKSAKINLGIRFRFAHLMENDRRKIELMNLLMFTLPGTPVVYYGDEILMGDNASLGDRDGVRTPMQWNGRKNGGFSKASKKKLFLPLVEQPEYRYDLVNVDDQLRNLSSHLWWMKRLMVMRSRFKVFGRGRIRFFEPNNMAIFAFVRQYQNEEILVAVNFSKFPQITQLELGDFEGRTLLDMFGGSEFPQIRAKLPLSFGPYGYYVFSMSPVAAKTPPAPETKYSLKLEDRMFEIRDGYARTKLETEILPSFIISQPWYQENGRNIDFLKIRDVLPLGSHDMNYQIIIIDVYFSTGLPEAYAIPISYAYGELASQVSDRLKEAVISKVTTGVTEGILFDGMYDAQFCQSLLLAPYKGTAISSVGKIESDLSEELTGSWKPIERLLSPQQMTSVANLDPIGILKFRRHIFEGADAELEIGRILRAKSFPHIVPTLGTIRYTEKGSEPVVLALFKKSLETKKNLWDLSIEEALDFILTTKRDPDREFLPFSFFEMQQAIVSTDLKEAIGRNYLEKLEILGRTTAEFHLALRDVVDSSNSAVPFSYLYQASLSYSMIIHARRCIQFSKLSRNLNETIKADLDDLISSEELITERFKSIRSNRLEAFRTLVHGNYELGAILLAENDMFITWDLPESHVVVESIVKKSPLNDVADMLRSIHRAAFVASAKARSSSKSELPRFDNLAHLWYKVCSSVFLKSYFSSLGYSDLIPKNQSMRDDLLSAILLDKCLNELSEELGRGAQMVQPSLLGIKEILIGGQGMVLGQAKTGASP